MLFAIFFRKVERGGGEHPRSTSDSLSQVPTRADHPEAPQVISWVVVSGGPGKAYPGWHSYLRGGGRKGVAGKKRHVSNARNGRSECP